MKTIDKIKYFQDMLIAKGQSYDNLRCDYIARLEIMKSVRCDDELKQLLNIIVEVEQITTLFVNLFKEELEPIDNEELA